MLDEDTKLATARCEGAYGKVVPCRLLCTPPLRFLASCSRYPQDRYPRTEIVGDHQNTVLSIKSCSPTEA